MQVKSKDITDNLYTNDILLLILKKIAGIVYKCVHTEKIMKKKRHAN